MSDQPQQKRTSISLSGILKHAKSFTTSNQKLMVSLILSENVSGKDQTPEYVSYKLTAVGEAAATLDAALQSGNLPFGKDADAFTIIHTENCRPRAQDVKAQNRSYENGTETLEGVQFNASVLSFTAFNVEIDVKTKGQSQGQAQPQSQPQGQAQPQSQPQSQPPAQPQMDSFDDDIPF
jgi:hypothetical protein